MHSRISLERVVVMPALLLAAALLGVGCASVSGGVQTPQNPPSGASALSGGHAVETVSVAMDEALPAGVVTEANQFKVAERLESRIEARAPTSGTRDLVVDVRVIGMRLRSTGNAIWWGFMSGADWLTVDVSVKRRGSTVKSFQTGVSTALGGFIYGGREKRVDRMVGELADRIVAGL